MHMYIHSEKNSLPNSTAVLKHVNAEQHVHHTTLPKAHPVQKGYIQQSRLRLALSDQKFRDGGCGVVVLYG